MEKKPENVEQLITLVQQEFHYSDKEILRRILTLQNEGKIALKKEPVATTKLSTYLVSSKALWYWATLVFTAVTTAVVLTVPENVYPLVYIRIVLGTFFVLLMPGYTFVQALFPARKSDVVERIGLSIGMSIALVSLDAFILNFTPWEITLTSIVWTIALLIIIFATGAFLNGLSHIVAKEP
jgi:uncharacterized membrane protein